MAAEAVAGAGLAAARAASGQLVLGDGEVVLWEGRPVMRLQRLMELIVFLLVLGLLSWLAIAFTLPHLRGSDFAGPPEQSALPLILLTTAGTILIIAVPVWLRSSARARARYTLTNRRALITLGRHVAGEVVLFGAEMEVRGNSVGFYSPQMMLSWRLQDEGPDRLRFEQIAEALHVAAIAEEHGARWLNRPPDAPDTPDGGPGAAASEEPGGKEPGSKEKGA